MEDSEGGGALKLLAGFAVFVIAGLVAAPAQCLAGAGRALGLCWNVIIPSLFPFFVCSKLLIQTGAAGRLGRWCSPAMRPLFNVPGCGGIAFVLGILSGYPTGALCGVDMYEQNLCTKAEAERVICFCNNSGPLFIIGSVGAGMLYSRTAGITLYVIHIISAVIVGVIFRFYKRDEAMTLPCASYRMSGAQTKSVGGVMSDAVLKSTELIIYVCGFIVFFGTFTAILERFGIIRLMQGVIGLFGVSPDVSKALSFGFFEITGGAVRLAALPIGGFKIVLISILIAWSGVSVMLQVAGVMSKSGLDVRAFIVSKLLHSVIAGTLAMLASRLPAGGAEVFAHHETTLLGTWVYSAAMLVAAVAVCLLISLACVVYRNIKLK